MPHLKLEPRCHGAGRGEKTREIAGLLLPSAEGNVATHVSSGGQARLRPFTLAELNKASAGTRSFNTISIAPCTCDNVSREQGP